MRALIAGLVMVLGGGCASHGEPVAAILENQDAAAMKAIAEAASELNGRPVRLGPSDLTEQSQFTVLPYRPTAMEGNSVALPEVWELVVTGSLCGVRKVGETAIATLPGVQCRVFTMPSN